jgi:hypothetical protein
MTATLSSSLNPTSDAEYDLNFEVDVGDTWDGSLGDVSLSIASITTDLHGLTGFTASCVGLSAPYLCKGTDTNAAANSTSIDGDLNFRWKYSAFDQGTYSLSVVPRVTIESGVSDLSAITATVNVARQSTGNVTIIHTPVSNSFFNGRNYYHEPVINPYASDHTSTTPVVGLIFNGNATEDAAYFKRVKVDRQSDPATPSVSNNASATDGELDISGDKDSNYFSVQPLSSGDWVSLGIHTETGSSAQRVVFSRIDDDETNPEFGTASEVELTTNSSSQTMTWADMTPVFTDGDGETRFGFVYIQNADLDTDSAVDDYQVVVSKANVNPVDSGMNGMDYSDVVDDANYDSNISKDVYIYPSANQELTRAKIVTADQSGTRYFYVFYTNESNSRLVGTKILATGASPGNKVSSSQTLINTFLGDDAEQSYDIAMGIKDGQNVVGIVYNKLNGGVLTCYFMRTDKDLLNPSTPIALSTRKCWSPSIQYNSAKGEFVVVFAERNASIARQDVAFSTVTLGSSDSASSPTVIVDQAFTSVAFAMVGTSYDPVARWMAVFMKGANSNIFKLHGFHH